jgi:hypothetical protein
VCTQVCNTTDIHQVFGEFERSLRQCFSSSKPGWFIFEKFLVAVAYHRPAGTGGDDDRPGGSFQDPDGMLRQWPGITAQAGIEGRLAAAGLGRWKFNANAGPVQNTDHRFADVREEGIDQAGNEKLDGFGHILSGKLYFTFVLKVTQ